MRERKARSARGIKCSRVEGAFSNEKSKLTGSLGELLKKPEINKRGEKIM